MGLMPKSIATGDFDGDGNSDIVTANSRSNDVSVRLGNGDGGFIAPSHSEIAVGSFPNSVRIGDLNGDGNLDFALANQTSNTVSLRFGTGDGGFALPITPELSVGISPRSVAIGNFNGDGFQDLAVATDVSNDVSIRLGNGTGGFTIPTAPSESQIPVGIGPYYIAIGDFNGDGLQDFATANGGSNNISIRLGDGSGGFSQISTSEVPVGINPNSVVIGDFNGDGRQDFAASNHNVRNVSIRLGACNGPTPTPTPGSVTIGGRVTTPSGLVLRNAVVSIVDTQNVRQNTTTSSFGVYSFRAVRTGEAYVVSSFSKRYRFAPQIFVFTTSLNNVNFVGLE